MTQEEELKKEEVGYKKAEIVQKKKKQNKETYVTLTNGRE